MAEHSGILKKLGRLSAWQWRVLMTSPFILLLTWFRLRTKGYGAALQKARPARNSGLLEKEQMSLAKDTAYALAVAVKYGPWRPLCLLRSLTLGWFLGRKGIPFEVKIGVPGGKVGTGQLGKPDFTAHAWVEHNGVVLNDKEDVASEYAAF